MSGGGFSWALEAELLFGLCGDWQPPPESMRTPLPPPATDKLASGPSNSPSPPGNLPGSAKVSHVAPVSPVVTNTLQSSPIISSSHVGLTDTGPSKTSQVLSSGSRRNMRAKQASKKGSLVTSEAAKIWVFPSPVLSSSDMATNPAGFPFGDSAAATAQPPAFFFGAQLTSAPSPASSFACQTASASLPPTATTEASDSSAPSTNAISKFHVGKFVALKALPPGISFPGDVSLGPLQGGQFKSFGRTIVDNHSDVEGVVLVSCLSSWKSLRQWIG